MNKMQNLGLSLVLVVVASHIQNITDMAQTLKTGDTQKKFKNLPKPQQTKFIMTIIELLLYIIAAILCLLSFK